MQDHGSCYSPFPTPLQVSAGGPGCLSHWLAVQTDSFSPSASPVLSFIVLWHNTPVSHGHLHQVALVTGAYS